MAATGIAMLYLDVTVPEAYRSALEILYPLVSPGGLVVIDDWMRTDVQAAVLGYRYRRGICADSPIVVVDSTGAIERGADADWDETSTGMQRVALTAHLLSSGKVAVWRKPTTA